LEKMGLNESELSQVYYVALLGTVGCAAQGAAMSRFVKDDIAFGERLAVLDPSRPIRVGAFILGNVGQGDAPLSRARKVVEVARLGPAYHQAIGRDAAEQLGDFLNVGPKSRGSGPVPGRCRNGSGPRAEGEEIAGRAPFLSPKEVFNRIGGVDSAVSVVRRRAGRVYDPRMAEHFCEVGGQLLSRLRAETAWDALLGAEPAPQRMISPAELDELARTIANFVDMRSTYTLGHSPGVASLADLTALMDYRGRCDGPGFCTISDAPVCLSRSGISTAPWSPKSGRGSRGTLR
jgi:hypothetical protein